VWIVFFDTKENRGEAEHRHHRLRNSVFETPAGCV
jgi:hypothetical protein